MRLTQSSFHSSVFQPLIHSISIPAAFGKEAAADLCLNNSKTEFILFGTSYKLRAAGPDVCSGLAFKTTGKKIII